MLGHHIANTAADGGDSSGLPLSGIDQLGLSMLIAAVAATPLGFGPAAPAFAHPAWLLWGIGVGLCSSVIPYVTDQLAMARLPRATFSLMLALLPAAATVIGLIVLSQVPTPRDLAGIGLVILGVALHRAAPERQGEPAAAAASSRQAAEPASESPEVIGLNPRRWRLSTRPLRRKRAGSRDAVPARLRVMAACLSDFITSSSTLMTCQGWPSSGRRHSAQRSWCSSTISWEPRRPRALPVPGALRPPHPLPRRRPAQVRLSPRLTRPSPGTPPAGCRRTSLAAAMNCATWESTAARAGRRAFLLVGRLERQHRDVAAGTGAVPRVVRVERVGQFPPALLLGT